jgi:hypothetical protein
VENVTIEDACVRGPKGHGKWDKQASCELRIRSRLVDLTRYETAVKAM